MERVIWGVAYVFKLRCDALWLTDLIKLKNDFGNKKAGLSFIERQKDDKKPVKV